MKLARLFGWQGLVFTWLKVVATMEKPEKDTHLTHYSYSTVSITHREFLVKFDVSLACEVSSHTATSDGGPGHLAGGGCLFSSQTLTGECATR